MTIAACIIAGGKSTRMGRDKAAVVLAGRPLVQWVIDRLTPQVDALAINANGRRFDSLRLPVIADRKPEIGTPLAGLHAALAWAAERGFEAVVTVPADCPFLPHDLVGKLQGDGPAIAASAGQHHYLCGFWPSRLLIELETVILHRVQDWARHCGARPVDWVADPYDPFFNINTPDELAEAKRIAAHFSP